MKYETDSRKIKPGQIFVAIKGHTVDGHDYINQAVKNGAMKIICEKELDIDIEYEIVSSTEDYLKEVLVKEYSSKFKNQKIIGITGTNGKTTVSFLIYQMLLKLGKKASYIGTIGFFSGDEKKDILNTTPDILNLYKLLFEAEESEYVVIEISSHALELQRIAGIKLIAAGFTNFTQDHLDYHKTMENYFKSKMKVTNYFDGEVPFIINADDETLKTIKYNNKITFGKEGEYKIEDYKFISNKTYLTFSHEEKKYNVITNLTFEFNVYNYLMALSIVNSIGFKIEDIISITSEIYSPKGRNEIISINNSFAVIDYAHTPDAVLKIIKAYRNLNQGKIITVLGCAGDRDISKRPIIGEIATSESDYVIFTSDDPHTEDPIKILNDITRDNHSNNYKVLPDRKEAIIEGIKMLKDGDYLLVLGKGHEEYQIVGTEKIHFSDLETIEDYKNNSFK